MERELRTNVLGRRLVYLTSTGSTMDVARREAEDAAADGTVVVAEEQTSGRGRFGRSWVSPAGKNLYFTLILTPSASSVRHLSMITPLAVCRAVESVTSLSPVIKWPNDVLFGGRKLAGILIENEFAGAVPRYSLIGIGLNVNYDVETSREIADIATSLKGELGREIPREELLANVLNHFEELLPASASHDVHAAWRDRLETLGRAVTVTFREQTYEGTAEDVDTDGNLLLRDDDGSMTTFEAGEVSLRPPDPR